MVATVAAALGQDVPARVDYASLPRPHEFVPPATDGPRIRLRVPAPILPDDLEYWARSLWLSPAQELVLVRAYEDYIRLDNEDRANVLMPLHERASELGQLPDGWSRVLYQEEVAQLLADDRIEAIEHLESLEDVVWEGLIPFLTEEQVERSQCVRWGRLRARRLSAVLVHDGAKFDLPAEVDSILMSVEEVASSELRSLLSEYESAARPVARRVETETLLQHREADVILAQMGDYRRSGQAARPDLYERYIQLRERWIDAERRMLDLNAQFVERAALVLTGTLQARLLRRFDLVAYRQVYPDRSDLEPLFQELLADADLDVDVLGEVRAGHVIYGIRRQRINTRMEEEYLDWCRDRELGRSREFEAYAERMRGLEARRVRNALDALDLITAVVPAADRDLVGRAETLRSDLETAEFVEAFAVFR